MRRRLQRVDQQLPGSLALLALELGCIHYDDRVSTMQCDVLWTIAVRQPDQLAEARLGILQAPAALKRLVGRGFWSCGFSGHAD